MVVEFVLSRLQLVAVCGRLVIVVLLVTWVVVCSRVGVRFVWIGGSLLRLSQNGGHHWSCAFLFRCLHMLCGCPNVVVLQ